MVYSPSQLDAAGDVDPVAEADVYLAYGRDLQAEEILKEAMRTTPQRVAIHSKLLEIYSKRRDVKAFELVATEAYSLTHGNGPEWEHICELGQELDAGNALYRPGGQPAEGGEGAGAGTFGSTQATPAAPEAASSAAVDLDLDLDFSLGDEAPAPAAAAPEPTVKAPAVAAPAQGLDVDFGATAVQSAVATSGVTLDLGEAERTGKLEPVSASLPDLELSDEGLAFTTEPVAKAATAPELPAAAPAPSAAADSGMIEFDLGALSLDLPNTSPAAPAVAKPAETAPPMAVAAAATGAADAGSTGGFEESAGSGDPLATKFALAQEFNAIGDPDGARSLAEEVLAEASGDLKHRAQRFLAEIG
jgi:pilus assembly protein FimV